MNTTLGAARFLEWKGIKLKEKNLGGGVFLGFPYLENRIRTKRGLYFNTKRHFLSIAACRSGKGVSLIIPNLLQYQGSALVVDPKGENAWITAKWRRSQGQKVIILDPWGEVNRRYGEFTGELEEIATFNPLSILDPRSPHYADDLAYLADALIISQGKDPHWDDSARELVSGLMAYLVEKHGQDASFAMLRILLSKSPRDLAKIATEAQRLGPYSMAARKLGRFCADSRENASILSTALTQTAFLDSAALEESLSTSSFSFEDIISGRATIYLVLPVDKLQTHGRWLRLMISIGIRTVARNARPLWPPCLFVLDEFGTIGRLSAVAQAYGLMAGMQLCLWAFVQDLSQLKKFYPDDWETFISNSEEVSFFNTIDSATCNYLSQLLGTTTVERISVATYKKRKGTFWEAGDENYSSMSDQIFARELLKPEEIRTSEDWIGFLVGRHNPIMFGKIPYYEVPFFKKRARANPLFERVKPTDPQKAALNKIGGSLSKKDVVQFLGMLGVLATADWFSKKIKATWPTGEQYTFSSPDEATLWLYNNTEMPVTFQRLDKEAQRLGFTLLPALFSNHYFLYTKNKFENWQELGFFTSKMELFAYLQEAEAGQKGKPLSLTAEQGQQKSGLSSCHSSRTEQQGGAQKRRTYFQQTAKR